MADSGPSLQRQQSVHAPRAHDGARKHVAGAAIYIDDMPEPAGLLHLHVGQSTRAHARIVRLDLTAVRAAPGVVAVRGLVIPVVDLRLRLRLPAAPTTRESRILIVTKGEEHYGMVVDGVHQVVRLRDEDVEPPPRTLGLHEAEFLLGIGRPQADRTPSGSPTRMLILLQLDAVLTFPVGHRPGERQGAR